MLDPKGIYNADERLLADPRVHNLPLVIALSSPNDAGSTAGQMGHFLLQNLKSIPAVSFDVDQLHNYRERPPRVFYNQDHYEDLRLPTLKMHLVEDALDQPFFLLSGAEPDLQWRRFRAAVMQIVERIRPSLVLFVSAFPMPVPHTRAFPVTAHGSRKDLMEGISIWRPKADLRASMGSVLELEMIERGIDTVGFAVNIPQYISEADLPQGLLTALEHVSIAAHLSLPTEEVREASRSVHEQINAQVQANPEVARMVTSLEESYDANYQSAAASTMTLAQRDADKVPSRDQIGVFFEQYLDEHPYDSRAQRPPRSQGPGDSPSA